MASKARRVGFGLVASILALAAAEGVARLVAPTLPGPMEQPREDAMHSSELLGWAPNPGESRAFGVPAPTWINSMGIRGPEPEPRADGDLHLLTLGDSTVYGVLVGDDAVFSAVAAAHLTERLQRPVRAYNGGVPGYSSEQAWRLMHYELAELELDFVVIATLWSDCQPAPEPDTATIPLHFAGLRRAVFGSGLFRLIDSVVHGAPDPEQIAWELQEEPGDRRVPIDRYRSNLTRLAEMARDRGAQPIYLLLPSDRDLRREPLEPPRPEYREVMRAVASEQDALLVDGYTPFVGRDPTLLLDDVHPSAAGHRLLGETLSEAMLPLLER